MHWFIWRRRSEFFYRFCTLFVVSLIFFRDANLISDFCVKFEVSTPKVRYWNRILYYTALFIWQTIRRIRLHLYSIFPYALACNAVVYRDYGMKIFVFFEYFYGLFMVLRLYWSSFSILIISFIDDVAHYDCFVNFEAFLGL